MKPLKTAVVLLNVGSPSELTEKSIAKFLKEFLLDRRVILRQGLLWSFILNGIILRIRPKKLLPKYKEIFIEGKNPLLFYGESLANSLEKSFNNVECYSCMCYGDYNLNDILDKVIKEDYENLVLFPMYPQFSASTTSCCLDKFYKYFAKKRNRIPNLHFISSYYDDVFYIEAIKKSIISFMENEKKELTHLVFSFHGLPKIYIKDNDPYQDQCLVSGNLVAKSLNLSKENYTICFQSRFGPNKWIEPATDDVLEKLPKKGVLNIQVICIGFSYDCLETLEEINMENREVFLENGGKSYDYIPCLNNSEIHLEMVKSILQERITKLL